MGLRPKINAIARTKLGVYKAFTLGEKYPEIKLVRKTLRSLPDRFADKVAAIEEAKDVNTMMLDELMGSLQTFELNLKQNKKEKNITFRAEEKDSVDEGKSSDDEALVLLIKNFNNFLQKMNKRKNQSSTRTTKF